MLGLAVAIIVGTGIAASAGFIAAAVVAARQFSRRRPMAEPETLPGVTVLKPLYGAPPGLEENLATLCHQDYGPLQIVCGATRADDPAVAVVERVRRCFPATDLQLAVDTERHGSNGKIGNLHNMVRHARHPVLVIADSDVRVRPAYLRRLVAELAQPGVGAVTCLYRSVAHRSRPARFESLLTNTGFFPMALVAWRTEPTRYAFGATIALRRETLDAIGGFLSVADYLADDFEIGRRIANTGQRVVIAPEIVDTINTVESWQDLWHHQLRWARTYRICRPKGYFCSILTHATAWGAAALVIYGTSPLGLCGAGLIAARLWSARTVAMQALGLRLRARALPAVVAGDLLITLLWALAFLGRTVRWSGQRLRIRGDGRMDEIASPETAPRSTPASDGGTSAPARRDQRTLRLSKSSTTGLAI